MCLKNGTIFMLRVPEMGLFIFLYWYMFIWTMAFLVESAPWWCIWRGFCNELFLYFEEHGFYIGTGGVFWYRRL